MSVITNLSAVDLRTILEYDARTGVIRWLKQMSLRVMAGDVAGHMHSRGYRHIRIKGRCYAAHRIAWAIHYGKWPNHQIDHINRNRSDNRLENLREATASENQQNCSLYKSNTTGVRGVYVHKKRIYSQIDIDGKSIVLGTFTSIEEAASAFAAAKRKFHPFAVEYQSGND